MARYFFNNSNNNENLFLYTVGYEETKPLHKYGPTTRSGYMLHYIKSGKGTFYSRGKTFHLKAGEFFFIEPEEIIWYEADEYEPWAYYWIGFRGNMVSEYLRRTFVNKNKPIFSAQKGGDIIRDKIVEIFEISVISEDNDLLLNARLLEILYYLSECFPLTYAKKDSKNTILAKALQIMRNNFDTSVHISEIAKALYIDRTYLHRIFKEKMKIAPKDYLTNLRIAKAKELLTQTDYPVNIIAQSVGIEDAQNFSKLFKNKENISPINYRKSYKNSFENQNKKIK